MKKITYPEYIPDWKRALSSALIKKGVIEYHREDPHYSVRDLHVRDILKGKVKPLTEAVEPTELW
jgi:hypothetical protein